VSCDYIVAARSLSAQQAPHTKKEKNSASFEKPEMVQKPQKS
jgi:hypothetical protein